MRECTDLRLEIESSIASGCIELYTGCLLKGRK